LRVWAGGDVGMRKPPVRPRAWLIRVGESLLVVWGSRRVPRLYVEGNRDRPSVWLGWPDSAQTSLVRGRRGGPW
jgi:hypothetical protein